MANAEKILKGMRNNPRDWRIEDLKILAVKFGIAYRQQGTSHVTFHHPAGEVITVPAAKPIKPFYIKQFVAMLDRVAESE